MARKATGQVIAMARAAKLCLPSERPRLALVQDEGE
jgi:hypothetical protein